MEEGNRLDSGRNPVQKAGEGAPIGKDRAGLVLDGRGRCCPVAFFCVLLCKNQVMQEPGFGVSPLSGAFVKNLSHLEFPAPLSCPSGCLKR